MEEVAEEKEEEVLQASLHSGELPAEGSVPFIQSNGGSENSRVGREIDSRKRREDRAELSNIEISVAHRYTVIE